MVMKAKTKYLLNTIRKNGVTFFAVALIAATSIAIYLGLRSGADAILKQVDRYFMQNELASFEITCANGITQEDIEELSEQSVVDAVEGGYSTMVFLEGEQEKITVQVRSLLEEMNQPDVLEGELPKNSGEVAVEEDFAKNTGISIGDEIFIEHDGELVQDSFVVTAIINEPSFVCSNIDDTRGKSEAGTGSAKYYFEVLEDAFVSSYYNDCFTTAYIKNEELCDIYYYSTEYTEKENTLKKELEEFGEERAELRYESLKQWNIEKKDWVISGRNSMGDVRAIASIVDSIHGLSYSLALIFLMVAIVVCYASIVRMIDDQRILIGAQKALGFTTKEILLHYLKYNLLCGVLGIVIGFLGGVIIVENLILYVCGKQLLLERIPLSFVWKEAGIVSVLCLLIFTAATCGGCLKAISQPAISLLRGEVETQQKAYFFETWKLYKKRNLYTRTMIKNVLGDKGRILTTVMGVVGCISLLIITFTMKFALINAPIEQYENYFFYDHRLIVDSSAGTLDAFEEILQEKDISYGKIQDKLKTFRAEGEEWDNIHVIAVEEAEELAEFLTLADIESGKEAEIPEDGVLISRKCAENYDLSEGSVIELMDSEGSIKECRVAGVVEHYLPYHMLVTSKVYYEEFMEEEADLSVFLLQGTVDGLYEEVGEMDGFLAIEPRNDNPYASVASSLNMVITICLIFSAVLAVLVLMNQITMYINRKAKELSVMRINGYTLKETKAFVGKDNVVLTALGLILGCVTGIPIAYLEVRIIESSSRPNHYVRTPSFAACAIAVVVCIAFAWIINKIALRKVEHLSLTNVNGN